MSVVQRPELPFWKRIFLVELFQGMTVTFAHWWRKPTTEQYPKERPKILPRFRGIPKLQDHPDVPGILCIACNQCSIICPDDCITVHGEPRTVGKGKQAKLFILDYERCCLCGLCEEVCPTTPVPAIFMSHEYELARYKRVDLMNDMQELYDPQPTKEYLK